MLKHPKHPPGYAPEAATSFFSEVYHSDPRNFVQPEWMPTPSPPEVELDCSQFTESELARVIKRMKAHSAPSPFDRVGHIIFKKCPSLLPALVKLFNTCWVQSTIPGEWKCAAYPQELSLREYYQPRQLPTNCPDTLCWQALYKSPPESLAEVHGHQQVPGQFASEGFHANCAWLYGASSEAVVDSSRGPFQSQISGSLLVGFGQCLRKHTPLSTQNYMPRLSLLSEKLQSSLFKRGCTRGTLSQW